ncbi:hypothetical protein [Rhizobium sp. Root1203]|uniref:hypothetical protein n=1 Tax=Rhizobium sp. Root1203 TaxID=1736427 RepID=UPI000AB7E4D7|nr:hypothetical protein [Rhizobium sp. Root1203]
MSVDAEMLIQVLEEASNGDVEAAIAKHGASLSDTEKAQLRRLTPAQIKTTLKNLQDANKALNKMLILDVNNNL